MLKISLRNNHVTKERGNKCGKVGGSTSANDGHGRGKLGGGGKHGAKLAT